MKYRINDLVILKDSNEIKKITDIEIISNVVIYYFSDNTSVCENQILIDEKNYYSEKKFLSYVNEDLDNFIHIKSEMFGKNLAKLYLEQNPKKPSILERIRSFISV